MCVCVCLCVSVCLSVYACVCVHVHAYVSSFLLSTAHHAATARPNQPPSSAARQQALAIQQQHQQSGGASPIISQHGSAPDGKKLSGTSDASFDSHDSGDVPDGQRAQSHHRVSGKTNLAGRGFQPTPPLEVLKYRNAAATTAPAARTPDGTTSGLPETVHMAAPVVNKRDNSKSPVSSRKGAWRSSTSKSSHAILSSSVVSSDASIGETWGLDIVLM